MAYNDMNFKTFPICDSHVHIVARSSVDDSVQTFSEIMDYFKYERIGIAALTTECGHGESDHANNLKAFYAKDALNEKSPDSTYVYANPLYRFDGSDTAESYLAQAKELYRMGADGFKFLDGKAILRKRINRRLSDSIYDKMYAFFEEAGIPVLMHIADPRYFWGPREGISEYGLKCGWWCGDGSCPSFEQLHEEVYEILRKFPKLKFRAAHCFFLADDIDELTSFMENWENTSFDLTPGAINLEQLGQKPDEWRTFFKKYSKRIFFGTDTYNTPVAGNDITKYERWSAPSLLRRVLEYPVDADFVQNDNHYTPLGLDGDTLSDIYIENHKRLHPHARELDLELIAYRAKEMLSCIEARLVPYDNEERYKLEEQNMRSLISRFGAKN